ncbi:MAG: chromosome segregation protein SMC [Christensenellales bacterium]|jgi:chromosome segregation protein
MYLKKLVIYGFKSFGEKIEIEFNEGITAIVGPNGSGKSNVADAVRWVLGEQSAKSLRGARMEDVIFSGTEKRKALSYCEVILVFENSSRWMPVEYSEVAVARRVYRSGESEYSINKTPCRLKDITALFRDTGIGREGYSIVSQGKIDDILSNKKDERRAVFEEAAGVMKYRVRKEEAERKLSQTRSNMLRISDKLDELSEQLGPLKEQSEKTRKFLGLRERLRELEISLFLHQYDRGMERINSGEASLKALEEEAEMLERSVEELDGAKAAKEMRQLDEAISEAQSGIIDLTRELEKSEGKTKVLSEKAEALMREADRLALSVKEDGEKLGLVREELSLKQGEAASKEEEKRACELRLKESGIRLEAAAKELEESEKALEEAKAALMQKMNSIADAKNRETRLITMRQSILLRSGQLDAQLGTARQKQDALYEELCEAKELLDAIRQGCVAAEDKRSEAEKAATDARESLRGAQAEAAKCETEINSARSRLKILSDMERDYEGYYGSVKALLKAAGRDKEVQSRFGAVVAQVLSVPGKFERAVEMALGATLQNIITETEHDAKYLIEYLRKNSLGRATFLPLSSMKPRTLSRDERASIEVSGCFGVASELVSYDDKYAKVAGRLLGRTVITENLDTAISMMRKSGFSFTAVTLDGDIMHPGGSMSGGSVQARTSNILGRERLIEQTRRQIAALENKKEELALSAEQLRERLATLRNAAAREAEAAQAKQVELAREEEKCETVEKFCAISRDELEKLELEKEQLSENMADIEARLSELGSEQSHLEIDESGEREQIKNASTKTSELRGNLEAEREQNTSLRVAFARLEKELMAAQADAARLTREEKALFAGINAKRQELEKNETQRLDILALSGDESESGINLANRLESARIGLRELERLRQEASEEAEKTEKERKDMRASLQAVMEKKYKLQVSLEKSKMDIEAMQARIWEDYEVTYGSAGCEGIKISLSEAKSEIATLKEGIRELGPVNPNAIEDYRNVRERHDFYMNQRTDLEKAASDLEKMIEDMLVIMRKLFKEQFDKINANFASVFKKLFGGGSAELVLKDDKDVLNSDIDIIAQPPGKRLQLISLLSGGEKALTAISILFAMLSLKPTPFCVLDEIEASLDEANVAAFADYLCEYSKKTQFVVITHRKGTMERSNSMYGMAMEEKGVSKLVSVRFENVAAKAAAGG